MSDLSAHDLGLKSIGKIQHNLSYDELFEQEKKNHEGAITENGHMMVGTRMLRLSNISPARTFM